MVYVVLFSVLIIGSIVLGGLSETLIRLNNYFFSSIKWSGLFLIDECSIVICLMLLLCLGFVVDYTYRYFGYTPEANYLLGLIYLFVGVMGVLVFTGDFVSTLIFWEYLGVVSVFLILFYLNYLSLRASIITLVSSRFGDVALFILVGSQAFISDYWAVWVCLLFVVFTKSASFPFISWLLEAMRAPTPVSSLVHSSTLVAAGVWFALRYDLNGMGLIDTSIYVFLLSTVLITGISSFFFFDLKKIVALSTCNNINWCVIYLLVGGFWLRLIQLVCHGVSKCLLFMLVGDVMSGTGGSQASNYSYSSVNYGRYGRFGLICIILGLSGAPFIGVFFSKHFMLCGVCGIFSLCSLLVIFFGALLSYLYSYRLCRMLISPCIRSSLGVLFTCSACSTTYWWLFLNYLVCGRLDETYQFSVFLTQVITIFQLFSCYVCWSMYNSVIITGWCGSLFGVDKLPEGVYVCYNRCLGFIQLCLFRWDRYCLSTMLPGLKNIITPFIRLILCFLIVTLVFIVIIL